MCDSTGMTLRGGLQRILVAALDRGQLIVNTFASVPELLPATRFQAFDADATGDRLGCGVHDLNHQLVIRFDPNPDRA